MQLSPEKLEEEIKKENEGEIKNEPVKFNLSEYLDKVNAVLDKRILRNENSMEQILVGMRTKYFSNYSIKLKCEETIQILRGNE